MKYYFAWKNAEGACNLYYCGFEGFDENGNAKGWEYCNNINIIDFETAPNLKQLSAAWNKKTANWLARYIYMRTGLRSGNHLAKYDPSPKHVAGKMCKSHTDASRDREHTANMSKQQRPNLATLSLASFRV